MPSTSRSRGRPGTAARVAALCALLALAVSACSSGGGATAGGDASAPVSGGTLTVNIPADEGCVDPQQNLGRTQLAIGRAVVDSLVYQEPGRTTFAPWLAESWTVEDGGATYRFVLRDGVTFSDGSPLTAETVKANFDGIIALGSRARLASTYLVGYQGTDVVDQRTARVRFDRPNAAFLQAVATPSMGIVSTASAALPQAQRCQGAIVGSGPFTLASYQQNQSQTLQKRPGYTWGPTGLHQGEAYLDRIEVRIVPESGVRTGALISGQSDVMMEVQKADVAALRGAGLPIEARSNPGLPQQYFVNTKSPVLADRAVRQALQIGIDRQELVSATLTEFQKVATGALSSTTPGYVDLSPALGYDPDRAANILDAGGWVPGPDGIRVKDGRRLEFSVLYGSALYGFLVPLMELNQQQLKRIGMDVTLRPLPDADANAAWIKGDYDLRISGLTRGDPDVLRTGLNGLSPQLDPLLAQQLATTDEKARMDLVAQAQRIVIDEGIAIPINELSLPLAHQETVRGVTFSGDSLLLLAELWKQQ
jgi:peptide/nickel transport system substrate-binding protein